MKTLLLIVTLILSTSALANDASKREKIHQLAKAQGLERMFQEQIEQSREGSDAMAIDFFDKLAKDSGLQASSEEPEVRKLLVRFAEQAGDLYTAREYMDAWTSTYGEGLSEADIDNMLQYYRSPVGQRDIGASQLAMRSFTQKIMKERTVRINALTENLIKDLKAITTK